MIDDAVSMRQNLPPMSAARLDVTEVPVALYQEKGRRFRFRGERHRGLWEIFCLDRGRAYVRVGARRFQAAPGECFLYPAGAFHQHQATRGHAPHYITVAFRVRGGRYLAPLHGRRAVLPPDLRTLLARVVAESPGGRPPRDPASAALQRALLTQFLVEWLRTARRHEQRLRKGDSAEREVYREKAAHEAVEKALRYVEEHVAEDVSLEAAASAAGVSPPYLRQLARRHLGHSLREALKRARIAYAKHLLSQSAGNVKTVAAAAGYESAASFARVFRAVTGQSPSAYARTIAARGPTPWRG